MDGYIRYNNDIHCSNFNCNIEKNEIGGNPQCPYPQQIIGI